MRSLWIKLLLLGTFAYWASGAAKFVHEMVEHHLGHPAGVAVDDDDDDDGVPASSQQQPLHHGHPCPVCQMLAAMVADPSAPPPLPAPAGDLLATLVIADWQSPLILPAFHRLTTGPPADVVA